MIRTSEPGTPHAKERPVKKASKKAKGGAKAKAAKTPLSGGALRDLELLHPAASPIKGGGKTRRPLRSRKS
jgi:hypothetical protein